MEQPASRVAVVTGGARGIGRAVAERLASQHVQVVIGQLGADKFRPPPGCQMWELDVAVEQSVNAMIDRLIAEFGRIDVLVNNAALTGPGAGASFLQHSAALFTDILAVNLLGPFLMTKAAAIAMIDRAMTGAIVNVASIDAFVAEEHAAGYVSAKAGLLGLTRAAAVELAPYGIRVNAVAPGQIFTEAGLESARDRQAGRPQRHYRIGPLGEGGQPQDVADVTVFLASDGARWITGATIPVDGGYLAC